MFYLVVFNGNSSELYVDGGREGKATSDVGTGWLDGLTIGTDHREDFPQIFKEINSEISTVAVYSWSLPWQGGAAAFCCGAMVMTTKDRTPAELIAQIGRCLMSRLLENRGHFLLSNPSPHTLGKFFPGTLEKILSWPPAKTFSGPLELF